MMTPRVRNKRTPVRESRWNLSDLFSGIDDPKISASFKREQRRAGVFRRACRKSMAVSGPDPQILLRAIRQYESILRQIAKVEAYAHLVFAADALDSRHGAFLARIQQECAAIRKELLFFELSLSALPGRVLRALSTDSQLKSHANFLKKVLRARAHRLTETEERIMADKAVTGRNTFLRFYEEELARCRFRVNVGGMTKELNEPQTLDLLYNSNRNVRKSAALAFTAGLREIASRLALILNSVAADKHVDDRLRQFSNAESERDMENEIERGAVETIERAVVAHYAIPRDFYRFKASVLGLKPLYDFDRYAPIGNSSENVIPFERARDMVLEAFAEFSPVYAQSARDFFDRNWIDASPRPGKRGGAFCSYVTPDLHPYVFLNYDGTLKGVLTLAHELGHGIHASLARCQPMLNFDWPLITAETASVFGEMLVFRYLAVSMTDPRVRFSLYMQKIDEILATIFRQIALYRFEREFHRRRRSEGELPVGTISAIWRNSQQELFGGSVVLTPGYDIWWAYISHFYHTPFYVYAYAFGELITLSLWSRYERDKQKMADQYLSFLRAGGSKTPQDLLRPFGADLNSRLFWEQGINMIGELVREAKQLYRSVRMRH